MLFPQEGQNDTPFWINAEQRGHVCIWDYPFLEGLRGV